MINNPDFPQLTADNHHITSPPSPDYNCIAWAAGDTENWWQPGVFWPVAAPPDAGGIVALEVAYRSLGFEVCADAQREPGFEKIALYGSAAYYTHAARQLPNGKWTSKLGGEADIEHDSPEDVGGGIYAEVVRLMRRAVAAGS
jgi:hypothetical protein